MCALSAKMNAQQMLETNRWMSDSFIFNTYAFRRDGNFGCTTILDKVTTALEHHFTTHA